MKATIFRVLALFLLLIASAACNTGGNLSLTDATENSPTDSPGDGEEQTTDPWLKSLNVVESGGDAYLMFVNNVFDSEFMPIYILMHQPIPGYEDFNIKGTDIGTLLAVGINTIDDKTERVLGFPFYSNFKGAIVRLESQSKNAGNWMVASDDGEGSQLDGTKLFDDVSIEIVIEDWKAGGLDKLAALLNYISTKNGEPPFEVLLPAEVVTGGVAHTCYETLKPGLEPPVKPGQGWVICEKEPFLLFTDWDHIASLASNADLYVDSGMRDTGLKSDVLFSNMFQSRWTPESKIGERAVNMPTVIAAANAGIFSAGESKTLVDMINEKVVPLFRAIDVVYVGASLSFGVASNVGVSAQLYNAEADASYDLSKGSEAYLGFPGAYDISVDLFLRLSSVLRDAFNFDQFVSMVNEDGGDFDLKVAADKIVEIGNLADAYCLDSGNCVAR